MVIRRVYLSGYDVATRPLMFNEIIAWGNLHWAVQFTFFGIPSLNRRRM